MNAGAEKDDAKEKRKTFSWNDETKLFALHEKIVWVHDIEKIKSSSELHVGPSIPRWS